MSFVPETPDGAAASLAPGADEVSVSVAALFESYARAYQAIHHQFSQLLTGDADGAAGAAQG